MNIDFIYKVSKDNFQVLMILFTVSDTPTKRGTSATCVKREDLQKAGTVTAAAFASWAEITTAFLWRNVLDSTISVSTSFTVSTYVLA